MEMAWCALLMDRQVAGEWSMAAWDIECIAGTKGAWHLVVTVVVVDKELVCEAVACEVGLPVVV